MFHLNDSCCIVFISSAAVHRWSSQLWLLSVLSCVINVPTFLSVLLPLLLNHDRGCTEKKRNTYRQMWGIYVWCHSPDLFLSRHLQSRTLEDFGFVQSRPSYQRYKGPPRDSAMLTIKWGVKMKKIFTVSCNESSRGASNDDKCTAAETNKMLSCFKENYIKSRVFALIQTCLFVHQKKRCIHYINWNSVDSLVIVEMALQECTWLIQIQKKHTHIKKITSWDQSPDSWTQVLCRNCQR